MKTLLLNLLDTSLARFKRIDYLSLKEGFLMNRRDSKYLVNVASLPKIIDAISSEYKLMTVENVIYNRYVTEYYDTADFSMYMMHHNGHKSRYKLRKRTYESTSVSFYEFKEKNNKSVTYKSRKVVPVGLAEKVQLFDVLPEKYNIDVSSLENKITIQYDRITFVGKTTRITIDTNLRFTNGNTIKALNNTAIVEYKYRNPSEWRLFNRIMLNEMIRPISISKYCIGMSYLYTLKNNNFRTKLTVINKIERN